MDPEIERARSAQGLGAFENRKLEAIPIEFENPASRKLAKIIRGKTKQLWPKQCDALATAYSYDGLFAPIGVGHGKTFISLLLPHVMDSERALLFIPPKLCSQLLEADIPAFVEEFGIEYPIHSLNGLTKDERYAALSADWNGLMIFPYSLLSVKDTNDMLDLLDNVDLVIADECHYLRNKKSARTKRFEMYLEWQEPRFCCMSGTITQKSIRDYKHLIDWSLASRSPLPQSWIVLNEWDELLRPDTENQFPLLWSQRSPEVQGIVDWAQMNELFPYQAVEQVHFRKIYAQRLHSCPGVVATSGSSVDCSLEVETETFKHVPPDMQHHIENLTDKWVTPDGELIEDALAYGRYLNQLINGFYYECFFPPDTPDHILEKSERHGKFKKELRKFLERRREKDFDTPFLALEGLRAKDPRVSKIQGFYDDAYHDGEEPKKDRRQIWLSDWKLQQAADWVADLKEAPGIIWYQWNLMGEKLYDYLYGLYGDRVVYCPADCDYSNFVGTGENKDRVLVAAVRAHGTGKNLQHYARQFFLEWTAGASMWEQAIGRCHRAGQGADEVRVTISCATGAERTRFMKVLSQARYMEETGAGAQKLLFADYDSSNFAKIARNAKVGLDISRLKFIL